MRVSRLWFASVLGAVCACAGVQTADVRDSSKKLQEYVLSAERHGVGTDPTAARQLQVARNEIQASENKLLHNEPAEALSILQRARADAELAVALENSARERWYNQQLAQQAARSPSKQVSP